MSTLLEPPRVETETTPQPLREESGPVDITFRTLSAAPDWDSALAEWTGFVEDPATLVGF
jgi:hypothetical protein